MPADAARRSRGAVASTCRWLTVWPVVAPTKRPYGPFGALPGQPDEDAVLGRSWTAAKAASADVLEIDMAHGYLLGSYLSPLTNDEDDRLRFPVSVLEAVRAAWGGALAVRLSVTDWHPRGNTVEDGIEIAQVLAEHGVRPDPRRGRPDHPRRPPAIQARLPDRAQRPRPQRCARPDARRRLPDDARRGEHDRRRRARAYLVLLDLPDTRIERTLQSTNAVRLGEVRA